MYLTKQVRVADELIEEGRISYLQLLADWSKYLSRNVCSIIHVFNSGTCISTTHTCKEHGP